MVSFKVFLSLAVMVACAHAQPTSLTPHQAPGLTSSLENAEPQIPDQSGEPLHALAKGSALEEIPKQEGTKEDLMRQKKAVVYDAFAYTYPAIPLVTSYQYQYQRAFPTFPYAYSAAYYPYVYGPSYIF